MKRIALAGIFACTTFLSGCRMYERFVIGDNKEAKDFYDRGYDPIHVKSCGPAALHNLFKNFGEEVKQEDISKEILAYRGKGLDLLSNILLIPNARVMEITLPGEIIETIKRHGYKVEIVEGEHKDLEDRLLQMGLNKEPGIIRMKSLKSGYQHWIEFPPEKKLYFFGDKNTEFMEVYAVVK